MDVPSGYIPLRRIVRSVPPCAQIQARQELTRHTEVDGTAAVAGEHLVQQIRLVLQQLTENLRRLRASLLVVVATRNATKQTLYVGYCVFVLQA